MEFRLARQDELGKIHQLYRSVVGQSFCVWNDRYPGREEISADYESGNLFVLTQEDTLIGALSVVPEKELDGLSCWRIRDGSCEIARVVVSPGYQGQGLALRMVHSSLPILAKRGCTSIHLSVAKTNLPARKTYEKAGFSIMGEASLFGGSYYLLEKEIGK